MFCRNVDVAVNRRAFFARFGVGLAGAALLDLLRADAQEANPFAGILSQPHHAPKAKRIISLFMAGGPSQLDLYDHKPLLNERNG